MILLSAQRREVPEIARIFSVSRATVRLWMHAFDAAGPAGLYDAPRSGRPRKVTDTVCATLVSMIQQDPQQSGYVATFWTVAMLVLAVFKKLDLRLSPSTVRSVLQALDLRGWPRLAMLEKTDPDKAAKQWAIAQRWSQPVPTPPCCTLTNPASPCCRCCGRCGHCVGQQVRIPTPGSNVSRALFGALNIRTGRWVYLVRPHMRKEDFIVFLEHLLTVYAQGTIILIVDNYSSHTARVVTAWLEAHPRLQLYYLPSITTAVLSVGRQSASGVAARCLLDGENGLGAPASAWPAARATKPTGIPGCGAGTAAPLPASGAPRGPSVRPGTAQAPLFRRRLEADGG